MLFITYIFYFYNFSFNLLLYIDIFCIIFMHAQFFHYNVHKNKEFIFMLKIKDHYNHHLPPHNKNFCIITGWANPLLNKILKVREIYA